MKQYDFNIDVRRTNRRKTLSLKVVDDVLRVSIPMNLTQTELEKFIDKNHDWILRHLAKNTKNQQNAKTYEQGESWTIFGKPYILKIQLATKNRMALNDEAGEILLELIEKDFFSQKTGVVRKNFILCLDAILQENAQELVQKYADKLGFAFGSVGIKEYKSMWGLCRGKEIFFNRKLIFAPKWIFEYVVVHEVCHLKHPHHQKEFWQEVGKFYPQYKAAKQWLKLKGDHLMNIKL